MYEVKEHANGYVVILRGAERGVSTHADILDALHMCRVANRFLREQIK